jgi:hypothetical protein
MRKPLLALQEIVSSRMDVRQVNVFLPLLGTFDWCIINHMQTLAPRNVVDITLSFPASVVQEVILEGNWKLLRMTQSVVPTRSMEIQVSLSFHITKS